MSVSDGQLVNAAVTNAAFISKTALTGNTVTGIVSMQNGSSGGTFLNLQQEVNLKAYLTDTRFPTAAEKNALAGTFGTPDTGNEYVTDTDPRVPTQTENDALIGTFGTPSTTNPYVTDSDPRLAGASESTFSIANNQSTTNVTGLLFNSASTHGAFVEYVLRRRTDTQEEVATGRLTVRYFKDAATWDINDEQESSLDISTLFTITSGGQVQYATDNMTGANYFGQLRWFSKSFGVFAS